MRDLEKVKVIVVAGDKGKSHPVLGTNKAFLDVGGLPIVTRVVWALNNAETISEIYVVGPKSRLEEALAPGPDFPKVDKPLHILEQRSTLYENIWYAFLETLPSHQRGESVAKIAKGPDADSVVLIAAADMPLLTSAEVDEFVSKCDMERYDYVVGVTREEDLTHYYPRKGSKGIRLAYLHFREGSLRQNNMHMVRPFKVHNRHYVQTMYDLRYQKEFANIARLTWEILKNEEGGWGALGNYLLLQLSLLFSRLRLGFLRELIRRVTHAESVARCVSKLMNTRFGYAYTSLGGAALDVDKEREYEVLKLRFSEWKKYQEDKFKKSPTHASPQ